MFGLFVAYEAKYWEEFWKVMFINIPQEKKEVHTYRQKNF